MSAPGSPKGEYRSAQREGNQMTAAAEGKVLRARRRAIGSTPTRERGLGSAMQGGGP
jgi:hypothetical protein